MAIEIVSFPMKMIFHSYVKLPEGKYHCQLNKCLIDVDGCCETYLKFDVDHGGSHQESSRKSIYIFIYTPSGNLT